MDVVNGGNVLASFGATTYIGEKDKWHQEMTSERTEFKYNDETYSYVSSDRFHSINVEARDNYYLGDYKISQYKGNIVIGRR